MKRYDTIFVRTILLCCAAVAAHAAQPATPAAPGAKGNVAGHVPDQKEQAQQAPISPSKSKPQSNWWSPGDGKEFPAYVTYDNEFGKVGLLNKAGPIVTRGHAFFEPIGANGRACVTCHQPDNGMSISTASIKERWEVTQGKDPLFAAVDGSNCPNLPQADPASHSLLMQRGLFRIFLPWPPKDKDGKVLPTEFDIEVVRDPTGCNSNAEYGIKGSNPMISVYRRPRVVANTKYITHQGFGVGAFNGKNGLPTLRDPETGKPVSMNIMADAREPTLKTQAVEAAITHLQFNGKLDEQQLKQITDFEGQVYSAQVFNTSGGSLVEPNGPPALGPENLFKEREGVLGNNITAQVFPLGDSWKKLPRGSDPVENAKNEMRESIARGGDIYMFRTFWIRDAMHLNTVGLGNPTKRTCATCHGMHMTGMDVANGWMDIGTMNLPWAREVPQNPWEAQKPDMPLFKVTCSRSFAPHPFLGRVIYTQDPGRALITGKCNDVGTIVMQQFRGLSARAPYFANGSANTLRDLVDFYDRRFSIGYTTSEKADLVNFLSAL